MKNRSPFRLIAGVVALGVLLWGGYRASGFFLFLARPAQTEPANPTYVLVEKGTPPAKLSKFLEKEGVVSSSRRFYWLGQFAQKWKKLKAGEYELSANMTPMEVFRVLTSGISVSHSVTIQEGKNMYQIAEAIAESGLATKKEVLELARSASFIESLKLGVRTPTLEGYLFPDTYFFNRTMNPKEMLIQMAQKFRQVWKPEYEQRAKKFKLSKHEVITLASIIEKETGAPHERPLISSVFHNRLRKRMRLQSDPTTIYGMWEKYTGNIKRHHLKEKNKYNTYMMRGLPVGPIANPGKEAIEAALYPEKSPYLYFVSKNDGTHVFTKTFEEHSKAVRAYQMNRKARRGKSWRDLSRKLKNKK